MLRTITARTSSNSFLSRSNFNRTFRTTTATMVKVGDSIPSVDLYESSPGDKVNLAEVLKGKGLIIGVPAAFSTYIHHSHARSMPAPACHKVRGGVG